MARKTKRKARAVKQEEPVLDKEGNPIVVADAPDDDEERGVYTVGKGGLTARGKTYVEGDHIMLSELEADQITDMGNHVTATDPMQAKATEERRVERDGKRRERHAAAHADAQEAMVED